MRRIFFQVVGIAIVGLVAVVGLTVLLGRGLPAHMLAADVDGAIYVIDAGRNLHVDVSPPAATYQAERHPLWSPTQQPAYAYPVWSPDGKQLAFHKWYGDSSAGDIVVMDVFTRTVKRYTARANFRDTLSWSPDGTQITYIFVDSPDPAERYNVALLDLAEAVHTPITRIGNVVNPQWSPDGNWISFRYSGKVAVVAPVIRETFSPGVTLTDRGSHQSVAWVPGSGRLSLLSHGGTLGNPTDETIVQVINPSAQANSLFDCGAVNPDLYAVWSPDGQRIATHINGQGFTVLDIHACSAQFMQTSTGSAYPVWLTDERVVFSEADELLQVYVKRGRVRSMQFPGTVHHIAQRPH